MYISVYISCMSIYVHIFINIYMYGWLVGWLYGITIYFSISTQFKCKYSLIAKNDSISSHSV